jgi:hypothetical protein
MAYTTINKPSEYFNTKLYTGTGSSNSVTGVGFQPDFTWIKARSFSDNHELYDAVRGVQKRIMSNSIGAEETRSQGLLAFSSDGFTVGTSDGVNQNTETFASWNWKANGAGVSNTDGSITSTVSANTTSGFSIVSWVATGSVGTIGHGLGVAPKMIIGKNRTSAYHWQIGHSSIGWTNQIRFTTDASSATNQWNNTAPTSSVFSVEQYDINKEIGDNSIAYCFAEVKGFSKFGSYVGNGNADGAFIYTGFKPSFFMWKRSSSTGGWYMSDSKRDTFNEVDVVLSANDSGSESDQGTTLDHDFLSNGIKIRNSVAGANSSGETFIYMAFAEQPLVGTNNIPATAR